jgi:hypothetical protein
MFVEDLIEELQRLPLTARVDVLDGRMHRTIDRVVYRRGQAVLELDEREDDEDGDA